MANQHGALVVFGSGPGIGRNVGAFFAERGFAKIYLLSRDTARLQQDADFVRAAHRGANIETIGVDLADASSVQDALKMIDGSLAGVSLEAVLYNAARLHKSTMFEFTPEDLEWDLRISLVNLYSVARWAFPKLIDLADQQPKSTPSFLVTSGMLAKDPFPAMFSLAACKGGQYNLVHSLHKEFEPKGVHAALIVVGGKVADESKLTNARNIAEETWRLFSQPRGKGDLEVEIMDPAYADHIKSREQRSR